MRRMRAALLVALVLVPTFTWPEGTPLGPEFRINTYTTGNQAFASVATDASGNFVVVWSDATEDGSAHGVFGQRYASPGAPLGAEFLVNTYTTSYQNNPCVTADPSGSFIVVWESNGQDGSSYGIFGQRYASSGAPLGTEFLVNTYTTGPQRLPSVAADSSGNFVVAWQGNTQDGSSYGIFGQRYASSGAPLGTEFRVNTYTTGQQFVPKVAADPGGDFVVVWQSFAQDGSSNGVFGQRYGSSGAPLGAEFLVNTYTTNAQGSASVAADSSGNFVVAWMSFMQDGSTYGYGVFGQRYGSSGAPLGAEFLVNTYTTGPQRSPSVAADSSGNFVVVWQSDLQDGSSNGVFGQRYASSGTPLGPEFRVNTYTTNAQAYSAVASDPSGNFVVVWQSNTQDVSGHGIFGQRYSEIVPVELMRFGVE